MLSDCLGLLGPFVLFGPMREEIMPLLGIYRPKLPQTFVACAIDRASYRTVYLYGRAIACVFVLNSILFLDVPPYGL